MSTTRPIDFNSRFNEYKTKCNNLKEIYNIKDEIKLDIAAFNSSICANRWTKSISIPISFLLKVEDIPAQFRVSGLEDPRINDENFLRQVAQWLNTKISEGFGSNVPSVSTSDVHLKAAEALKDASGGIYENNLSLEWNQQLLAQEDCARWVKWTHDAEGNFLLDVLHPSLTERNKYLRKWSPSTQSRREVLV